MKTVSSGLSSHIVGPTTTLAQCWKITSTDNVTLGLTGHTDNLIIDGVTYMAAFGYTPSSLTTNISLAVSNMEVEGILKVGGFDYDDVFHGKWDHASIEVFLINYTDTTQGILKLRKGWIGDIVLGELGFTGEIRGLTQACSQKIVELYSPACRADLGDVECQVKLNPPTWQASTSYAIRTAYHAEVGSVVKPTTENDRQFYCTTAGTSGGSEPTWNTTLGGTTADNGVVWTTIQALQVSGTITSLTNNRVFFDTTRAEPSGFFDQGKIVWNGGNNSGRAMEVKLNLNTGGQIELVIPMVEAVQVGDAYTIHAGCTKDFQLACKAKFDNTVNFRGEPYVPTGAEGSILNT